MSSYLFHPKAPLLFRQGRPFGATDLAETLPFPRPDTIAGALRAAYLDHHATLPRDDLQRVAGPLLVRRALDGGWVEILFPKPADAVYLNCNSQERVIRLRPERGDPEASEEEGTDLPQGLHLVHLPTECHAELGKPLPGPAFWTFGGMVEWLTRTEWLEQPSWLPPAINEMGVLDLPVATRAHVRIDNELQSAEEGKLFQTQGVDFGPVRPNWKKPACKQKDRKDAYQHEYALLAHCRSEIPGSFRRLGGRSRLTYLEYCPGLWPVCPGHLAENLRRARGLRLVLATPAIFKHGWRPGWLNWESTRKCWLGTPHELAESGLVLSLHAVALDRWRPASGWDAMQGGRLRTRPLERMVPAGAVYWFKIESGIEELPCLWLAPLSDEEQHRRDGFGLALPGLWEPDKREE